MQFYSKSVSSRVDTTSFDIKGSLDMIEEIKFKVISLKVMPFLGAEEANRKGWWDTHSSNFLQNVLSYIGL